MIFLNPYSHELDFFYIYVYIYNLIHKNSFYQNLLPSPDSYSKCPSLLQTSRHPEVLSCPGFEKKKEGNALKISNADQSASLFNPSHEVQSV